MKTPDEIKKGLECCSSEAMFCAPEDPKCSYDCDSEECICRLMRDSLALIQQLEAELADEKSNHQHTIDIAEKQKEQIYKLKKVIVRLNKERDAAVAELELADCPCDFCRHLKKYASDEPCSSCKYVLRGEESRFEWRGVKEK